ncbi:membrane protein insertion efficiency factor YidD [Candidatus Woesebacteria bacterium RIFCSPHIGHO2_01_FULL_38_10]|uniref:Putative membrane protein insertion efficiency factor n=1 Tax=Candidatus Woesebacteria bacterium RIFCSPLOWO2_01_FULL_39_10b TaxID=1802517 RepID=A0A1F8BAC7_9BACT|nr:MAG: membrane protein insertion efficiency factor YidD [Candidatus Woesebacteria bacterium RIFCSPHIGHO2_01_FULL_38_10]OGM60345.1 MAG: membrane protein insertion efficiency factor YidD [Candidatus Woesebacteria bacterium RIFCSPLOWO2_01_FULL_39_10b]
MEKIFAKITAFFLIIYKNIFSRLFMVVFVGGCRFCPSCSQYFKDAVEIHGFFRGNFLFIKRFWRCNPFSPQGFDPVPVK